VCWTISDFNSWWSVLNHFWFQFMVTCANYFWFQFMVTCAELFLISIHGDVCWTISDFNSWWHVLNYFWFQFMVMCAELFLISIHGDVCWTCKLTVKFIQIFYKKGFAWWRPSVPYYKYLECLFSTSTKYWLPSN
jgi:hypothetical protein